MIGSTSNHWFPGVNRSSYPTVNTITVVVDYMDLFVEFIMSLCSPSLGLRPGKQGGSPGFPRKKLEQSLKYGSSDPRIRSSDEVRSDQ